MNQQPQQGQWNPLGNQMASVMVDQDMSGGGLGGEEISQTAGAGQTNNQKASERMRLDESEFYWPNP